MSHAKTFLADIARIAKALDPSLLEEFVERLHRLRERKGRLFLIGNGGSAANCSHAVNDFRKIAGIQAFTPVDNVAELTARANDDGWDFSFKTFLVCSGLSENDAVLVLSVGGGEVQGVSRNLVMALMWAKRVGSEIYGIVSGNGGYTAECANLCVRVPLVNMGRITPYAESFQSVLLHLIVTHHKFRHDYSEKNVGEVKR